MDEVFPIGVGLLIGALCVARWRYLEPWWARTAAVLLVAGAATTLSGEYIESWSFLLLDLSEVAVSGVVGYFGLRHLASRFGTGALDR